MDTFGQNKHVLQAMLHAARIHQNLFEWLTRPYRFDDANAEAARENTVVARSVEPFARLYFLLKRNVIHLALRRALPLQRAVYL
jgi:hypothetical protein